MTYVEEVAAPSETEEERAARKAARKAAKRAARDDAAPAAAADSGSAASSEAAKKRRRPALDDSAAPMASGDAKARKAFMREHRMTIEGTGAEAFFPVYTFAEANFPSQAREALAAFDRPTPIQAASWPIVLSGRDVIGIAETGSGKTMSFALPSLIHIQKSSHKGPKVLVLAPTRELAIQTADEFGKLKAKQVCVYGGASKGPQQQRLRTNPDVVVATPGRLQDFLDCGECDLSGVAYAVLDEADRMLDIGFEYATRAILKTISSQRQIVMFSATWPTSVQRLAAEFLRDPVKLTVGSDELTANVRVKQTVEIIEESQKDKRLLQLMKEFKVGAESRVLIFVLYKKDAPRVHELLLRRGYSAGALHGNSSQATRERTIAQFRSGQLPIMVATDVASRGLDVDDVELVVNYSMPLTIADYIHRIGRTARAGKSGVAHSFFMHPDDKNLGWHTARVLREAGQPVPPELEKYGPPAIKQEEKTCNISEVQPAAKITFADSDEE